MTPEAIAIRHSLIIEHLPHFVRLMAVHAGWQDMRFFFPQLTPDDFPVDVFDLRVALCTCFRNVASRDGGSGVGVGKDRVGRVA